MIRTSEAAAGKWHGILSRMGVDDSYLRNRHGPCPMCGGKDRFRFDDKDGRGTWICNQCGAGDGIDLAVRYTGKEFKAVAKEIDLIAGNVEPRRAPQQPDPRKRLRRVARAARAIRKDDPVGIYLSSRGVSPMQPLRAIDRLPYYQDGEAIGEYPAMAALFHSRDGEPLTYHLTYLSAEGRRIHNPSKKILPPVGKMSGGAIRLGGLSESIGIAEGIETALAVSQFFDVTCWAATSATMLEAFRPPEGVTSVTVYADNDENYTGQKSAYALANRLALAGYGVSVFVPAVSGHDFHDQIQQYREAQC